MPPQDGRAGGLPVPPCQCTDYRKKPRPAREDDNRGWVYWRGKWWSPPEMQACNDAYWQGHMAGWNSAATESSWH
eukprot:15398933-Alexandrium_andersonii.AAC.1